MLQYSLRSALERYDGKWALVLAQRFRARPVVLNRLFDPDAPAQNPVAETHPLPPWQVLVRGQLSKDLSDPPLLILCESVQD